MFADDTSIWYSASNTDDVIDVANNQLDLWIRVNKWTLSVNKTNFMMFINKSTNNWSVARSLGRSGYPTTSTL